MPQGLRQLGALTVEDFQKKPEASREDSRLIKSPRGAVLWVRLLHTPVPSLCLFLPCSPTRNVVCRTHDQAIVSATVHTSRAS